MSIKYLQEKARYSGVGIFNWYNLSSPPQILLRPVVHLEWRWLIWDLKRFCFYVPGTGTEQYNLKQ